MKPKSKTSQVVVQEIGNETLVYNLNSNNAVCLNDTAALVWRLSDGSRTINDIRLEMQWQLNVTVKRDLILVALEQLKDKNLVENETMPSNSFVGASRREIIKRIGFASAIAIPLVSSVVAPQASNSQSLLPILSPCTSDSQCSSNNCETTAPAPVVTLCCVVTAGLGTLPGNSFGTNATQAGCSLQARGLCCTGNAVRTPGPFNQPCVCV